MYDLHAGLGQVRFKYLIKLEGVILSTSSCPITPVVSKASVGVAEEMKIVYAKSLPSFLKNSKEQGWNIIGTSLSSKSVSLYDVPPCDGPTILVLGNEGKGISKEVSNECDLQIKIPANSHLDSLNVGVAGGIVMYSLFRR